MGRGSGPVVGGTLPLAGGGVTAGRTPEPRVGGVGSPGELGMGNLPGDEGMGGAMPRSVRALPGGGGGAPDGLGTLCALGGTGSDVDGRV